MSRHIDAATVLLLEHYDMDQAGRVAHELEQRILKVQAQLPEAGPLDVLVLAGTMYLQPTTWWDSEDPKERAINQLGLTTLLLPSIEALVEDVEAGLGRPLNGETMEDKIQYMTMFVGKILAELKDEEYIDPMQTLLASLQGMPENLRELMAQNLGIDTGAEVEEDDDKIFKPEDITLGPVLG